MNDSMVDMTSFMKLYNSLDADEPHRGMSMPVLRLVYADKNIPIYQEMLGMLTDGVHIYTHPDTRFQTAIMKTNDKIICAKQHSKTGFMLYLDADNTLRGIEISVFDTLKNLGSAV